MHQLALASRLAALGLLLAPGAAAAATLVGASQVHVTSTDATYLQIAELLAFDFGGTNVAYAGNMGTVAALNQYSAESEPSNAIDGLYPRSYYDAPGIYHSMGTSLDYLNVFFGAPTNLASLTIYGRTDCCTSRDIFNVSILNARDEILYSGVLDARANGSATITFDQPVSVPEPATWLMMLAGFGAVGAVLRRRQRALAASASAFTASSWVGVVPGGVEGRYDAPSRV